MSKIAFLFSGQGSQYVGMGQSFYESSETARRLMDEANTLLPFDLKEICFEDSKELINQTTYTQPAIFVVSQMALALLKEAGINFDVRKVPADSKGNMDEIIKKAQAELNKII